MALTKALQNWDFFEFFWAEQYEAGFGKAPKPDSQNRNPILKTGTQFRGPKTRKRSENTQKVRKLAKGPKTRKRWFSVSRIGFWSLSETGQFHISWILEVWKLTKAKMFELS